MSGRAARRASALSPSIRRPARQRFCRVGLTLGVFRVGCDRRLKFHQIDGDRMSQQGGLMTGKRGLVMGVANERSIAWGIARAAATQGADLAFTYQGDALGKRV